MGDGLGQLLLRGFVVAGAVAGAMTLYRHEWRPSSLPAAGSGAARPTVVAPPPDISKPTPRAQGDSTIDLGDLSAHVGPAWGPSHARPPDATIAKPEIGPLTGQSARAALKPFHTRFLFSITGGGWPHWKELKLPPFFLGSKGGWEFYAGTENSKASSGHTRQIVSIECDDTNGSQADVAVECDQDEDDRQSQRVHLQMKDAQGVDVQLQCYTSRE